MDTGIKQESSLVIRSFPPRSVIPLVVRLNAPQDTNAKVVNFAILCSLAGGIGKTWIEAHVFGNGKSSVAGGADTLSIGDECASRGNVFSDRLFGEDVLASGEGCLYECRLSEDGKRDDDGGDVVSLEEVLIGFVGTGILCVEIWLLDGFGNEVCGFLS